MNEHYYSRKPSSVSNRHSFETVLRGNKLTLSSDAGVFSRDGVDYGSKVLIAQMQFDESAKVLDVGCGYGPIGLTAARLAPQGHATLIDINERAVELARHNAEINRIENVSFGAGDLFEAVGDAQFDVILSNPPIRAGKVIVHRLLTESHQHLTQGGSLWIVIQNKQGAHSAKTKLQEVFGEEQVFEIGKDKGYRIYRAVKE